MKQGQDLDIKDGKWRIWSGIKGRRWARRILCLDWSREVKDRMRAQRSLSQVWSRRAFVVAHVLQHYLIIMCETDFSPDLPPSTVWVKKHGLSDMRTCSSPHSPSASPTPDLTIFLVSTTCFLVFFQRSRNLSIWKSLSLCLSLTHIYTH